MNEVPPPVADVAEGVVSVIDFGAVPGDGVDDTAAVRKALAFAVKNKASRLYFGPGVFDFEEASGSLWAPQHWVLWLERVSDLEIDGGGRVDQRLGQRRSVDALSHACVPSFRWR